METELSLLHFALRLTLATCLLGIALDLVTAHLAVEYFTIHQPKVVESQSPIVMAFIWGVGASWWFGAISAIILWLFNRRRPSPLSEVRVLQGGYKALATLWLTMMLILGSVYLLGGLVPEASRKPTFEHDRRLMAVAITHMTEYVLGGIALVALLIWIYRATRGDSGE